MPSQIDFAIAVGIFIVFIAIIFSYMANYLSSFSGLLTTSELRSIAQNIFNILFGSKGLPENWEEQNRTPVQVGLITDLYRIPIVAKETNGTERGAIIVNVSLSFDINCEKKAWNSTLRVYEGDVEIKSQAYNQTFCPEGYVNTSNIFFNSSFSASQTKTFFVYFSEEKSIAEPNYSVPFVVPENFSVWVYPEERLSMLSISKLFALRKPSYEEVVRTLGTEYKFNVEISEK